MDEPKVYITFITMNGRVKHVSGLASKVLKKAVSRANFIKFKQASVRVIYARDVENEMDCLTMDDLKWALRSFLDKNLWTK